jgi:hypothetical protein
MEINDAKDLIASKVTNKWTWQPCFSASIKVGLRTGLDETKNSEKLMRWYRQFRVTKSIYVPKQAKNLPPIQS